MMRKVDKKKLALSKETLRRLGEDDLASIVSGSQLEQGGSDRAPVMTFVNCPGLSGHCDTTTVIKFRVQ